MTDPAASPAAPSVADSASPPNGLPPWLRAGAVVLYLEEGARDAVPMRVLGLHTDDDEPYCTIQKVDGSGAERQTPISRLRARERQPPCAHEELVATLLAYVK